MIRLVSACRANQTMWDKRTNMWCVTLLLIAVASCNAESFELKTAELPPQTVSRIVGGVETTVESYPFIVQVLYNAQFYCGGSLLTSRHVLSAAHCFVNESGTFFMYRLSYLYYTLVGMTVCIVVGSIVSYFTEPNDPAMVHRDLLTPIVHRWLPEQHPHCRRPRLTQHDIELHARELDQLRAHTSYDKMADSPEIIRKNNNNVNDNY